MKRGLKIIATLFLTLAFCIPAMEEDAAPKKLTVAQYKAMLEAGYPIELVRRAKKLFSWFHYTIDAIDNPEPCRLN